MTLRDASGWTVRLNADAIARHSASDAWRGITVPKGTPKPVIAKLENAIRRTVASAEFVTASDSMSVTPAFLPADGFARLMAKEDAELAQIMQALGLKKSAQ